MSTPFYQHSKTNRKRKMKRKKKTKTTTKNRNEGLKGRDTSQSKRDIMTRSGEQAPVDMLTTLYRSRWSYRHRFNSM